MKQEKPKKKTNVIAMPNQIRIVSLASLLQELMEKDHIKFCKENGVNPEDYPLVFRDFPEIMKKLGE